MNIDRNWLRLLRRRIPGQCPSHPRSIPGASRRVSGVSPAHCEYAVHGIRSRLAQSTFCLIGFHVLLRNNIHLVAVGSSHILSELLIRVHQTLTEIGFGCFAAVFPVSVRRIPGVSLELPGACPEYRRFIVGVRFTALEVVWLKYILVDWLPSFNWK